MSEMADTGGTEHPEITAFSNNLVFITDAVTSVPGTLQWFANCLVQKAFITRRDAQGILGVPGVTADTKANQLMDSVFARMRISNQKRSLFLEFVDIFDHDPVFKDLVQRLMEKGQLMSFGMPVKNRHTLFNPFF